MTTRRDAGMPAIAGGTSPVPPLPPVPAPAASDADWAAFRAAGRARRRAIARHVRARALRTPAPELRQWDGTPYPDLTADPAFEPWPKGCAWSALPADPADRLARPAGGCRQREGRR